eukprot:7530359-Ditylum_brightwellii.AAC.1
MLHNIDEETGAKETSSKNGLDGDTSCVMSAMRMPIGVNSSADVEIEMINPKDGILPVLANDANSYDNTNNGVNAEIDNEKKEG